MPAERSGELKLRECERQLTTHELKAAAAESKLTEQHRDIHRLRGQLEARDKDLQYVHRLLERARADCRYLQSELARSQQPRTSATNGGLQPRTALASSVPATNGGAAEEARSVWLESRLAQEQEVFHEALEEHFENPSTYQSRAA